MTTISERIGALAGKLSLEQKVALLTGRDFWNTVPLETIGLRNLLLSDGPAGVRGEFWDERDNSLNLPSGTALGSSWSRDLAYEYGVILGAEAERKGVDVVLGPTINLHRSPLGGRHFECLSEDPLLTGSLALNYISGMQSTGKGACPKHYVANDFETDRFNVNVVVDERPLRELYLRPFEDAVVEGKAWSIMSSYNSINGVTATENDLLQTPLRTDWGFDGVVISDWTAVRSLASAKAEQDLVMPGPIGPWGDALVAAVRSGEIDEAVIDRKIERILLLALRVGAIGENGKTPAAPKRHNDIAKAGAVFARKAAIAGTVLLSNDGVLPLNFGKLGKVALIGHNAVAARTQGGGSASVHPLTVSTPYSALKDALGDRMSYAMGAVVQQGIAGLEPDALKNPVTGGRGVRVEFFGEQNELLFADDREASDIVWIGSDVPLAKSTRLEFSTLFTPAETGTKNLGYASMQETTMLVNGEEKFTLKLAPLTQDPFEGLMQPPHHSIPVEVTAGVPVELKFVVTMAGRAGIMLDAFMYRFGTEELGNNAQELIDEAVANAKAAELAIVVVGTNSVVESEGYDRKDLKLPGKQDELVEAVVAANPNTIVVINSGSPVELPWRNKVRAILLPYFGGQEMGLALVDMLSGVAEPGGRLPTTWGATLADVPVTDCTPVDKQVSYSEGIHIGYRAWLKAGTKPAYEFGHGLGYTTWTINSATAPAAVKAGDDFAVSANVTNTGNRAGKHVVQVYASRAASAVDRPVRWLVGFAEVQVAAGETKTVEVSVRGREFSNWSNGWNYEAGNFQLHVGSSIGNTPIEKTITIG